MATTTQTTIEPAVIELLRWRRERKLAGRRLRQHELELSIAKTLSTTPHVNPKLDDLLKRRDGLRSQNRELIRKQCSRILEKKGKGGVDLDDCEMLKCLQSNEEAVDAFLAAHDEVEEVTGEVTKAKETVNDSQNERDRLKNELENAKQAVTKILGALCDSEMGQVLNEAMEIEALKDHYLLVSQVVSRVKNVTKPSQDIDVAVDSDLSQYDIFRQV